MNKVFKKVFKKNKSTRPETGGRITNETVAEHRERVLAGGRKFKYPLQYTKRRVLVISTIIVFLVTIGFVGLCGWALYFAQDTGQFVHRLTQVIPVPVAKVDERYVRYSDYLLELRSAIHYLTTKEAVNFNSEDGQRQLEYQKRLAMNKAIDNSLVNKLAGEMNINVSDKEVDDFVHQQVNANRLGVSEEVYKQVIRDYYDWSFDEYKNSVRKQLLRKKVNARLDTAGLHKIQQAAQDLQKKGASFAKAAKKYSEDPQTKNKGGDLGIVSKNSDDPSGLIAVASTLKPKQVSGIIEGADGFYIIKLLDAKEEPDVHFAKIFVSYKALGSKLAELKKNGMIQEFVKVNDVAQPTNQ